MHNVPTAKPPSSSEVITAPALARPRVSVIVTCFNYARFVADALDSIAAQAYPDWDHGWLNFGRFLLEHRAYGPAEQAFRPLGDGGCELVK